MLKTKDLTFSYDGSRTLNFQNMECKQGESWLILGQSGSGKTTLLHLLGGLLSPTNGQVIINEKAFSKLEGSQRDKFRGQNIGIIFQNSHFIRSINVEENLILAQQMARVKVDRERIGSILERLNVGHKAKSLTRQLSIGEQQRVAIARALVNRPQIILADEPTSALDDQNCEQVIQLLEEVAAEVEAILMVVTHDNRLKERFSNQINL